MDMEGREDLTACNEHHQASKGKRAKRIRPWSPIGDVGSQLTSSLSAGGGGGDANRDVYSSGTTPSPTASCEISTSGVASEEDEDMANCLILLARSGDCRRRQQSSEDEAKAKVIGGKKLVEMASDGSQGKVGFFVYECKTCNRTFSSFQALGGHRASHKKPKTASDERNVIPAATILTGVPQKEQQPREGEEDQKDGGFANAKIPAASPAIETPNRNSQGSNGKQNKIHECSICGSEFTSGQALGGHMRRHRAPIASSRIAASVDRQSPPPVEKQTRSILHLDLNLPAPEEDHRDSNAMRFPSSGGQQHLVFSGPALVDCHY